MAELTGIQKLPRQAGLTFGPSVAYPVLRREQDVGVAVGISEFQPGEVELDLTYDEGVFVLEGELEIVSEGATHRASVGEFLWLPRGRKLIYRARASCRFLYVIPAGSMPARPAG